MPLLRVIAGPDTGKTTEVDEAPVTIGRGDDCGLCLGDESVSVIHATVEPVNGGWRVRDLESTNGTAVNSRKVAEQRLDFGDTITVGQTVILFDTEGEAVGTGTAGRAEAPLPGDADGA